MGASVSRSTSVTSMGREVRVSLSVRIGVECLACKVDSPFSIFKYITYLVQ